MSILHADYTNICFVPAGGIPNQSSIHNYFITTIFLIAVAPPDSRRYT